MAAKDSIDQGVLRAALTYAPETGVFFNKRSQRACVLKDRYGYVRLSVLGVDLLAHQVAWAFTHGAWPDGEVDHINGVRDDNRIANLRIVGRSENKQNSRLAHRDNATGLLGVSALKPGKFRAQIMIQGRKLMLGVFGTAQEAHEAYMAAKAQHHPAFVR